jgi:hypothetical protein
VIHTPGHTSGSICLYEFCTVAEATLGND